MATGTFPDHPVNRKAILVLSQHEIEKCAYTPGAEKTLLSEEVHILPTSMRITDDAHPALLNIRDARLFNPGVMLVQSPFDPDVYEDAAMAPHSFAIEKHMIFSVLCGYLGAREVIAEQILMGKKGQQKTFDLKGKGKGVDGKLNVNNEELDSFCERLSLHDQFSGAEPQVQLAERFLRSKGLWSDMGMRSLVEMRRLGGNQILSRRVELNLSHESKSSLSVVGRVVVPTFVTLSAQYKSIVEEQHEYKMSLEVRF